MSLFDLQNRDRQPELMDQPGLNTGAHHQALKGLDRVNWFSFTTGVFWKSVKRLPKQDRPLRILDIACGSGDIALALDRHCRRNGVSASVFGCDISPVAIEYATQRAEQSKQDVRFFQVDLIQDGLDESFDVITCSLFLHHLDPPDVVKLLRQLKTHTIRLLLVSDLVRSRWGYFLARVGTKVLSRSPIVHVDGPLSVRAAFTLEEMREMCFQVPIESYSLKPYWPSRFLLEWSPE